MSKEKIERFIGENTISVVDAMKRIDVNAHGILFIVEENKLCGCLTDGDIRRWLIRTGDLKAQVNEIMNVHPKFLYKGDVSRAKQYMAEKHITALPILDIDKQIIDVVFASDICCEEEKEKEQALSEVPVVIMAGGKGTRLYPYTKILPKPLIPIGDVPIMERIINRFCDYGVDNYYFTVNYKKGMIKSYFSELNPAYSIKYVEENKPLGTGGSLKLIEDKFEKPFIVTNCDILIDADYKSIYQHHMESGNKMTVVSALKNIEVPYGVLHTKEDGIISSIEEKPRLSYFVNTGMYILNPDLLERIPEDTFYHMTDLVEELMKSGEQVGMYPISEEAFLDMGEFEEMRRMEEKLNIKSE